MTVHHDGPGPVLPIHEASALLGVPAPTLRSWELRYGIPATRRSPGGHRRYDVVALTQLGRMRDEIATGRRPVDAARRVLAYVDPVGPGYPRVGGMIDAAVARDLAALLAILDGARTELGLAATLDEVVMPTMRLVGTWWETGRCDIGDEHFATEIVRGWLAQIITLAPPTGDDPRVLLAIGPSDRHTIGLEALAALMAVQGTSSRQLGPCTAARMSLAAAAPDVAAAVVVSHLPTQRRPAVASLTAAAATGCPTYYAGNGFLFAANRVGVPGTYLGDTITGAARTITDALPREIPPAPLAATA